MLEVNNPASKVISIQRNFGEKSNYKKEPVPGFIIIGTLDCSSK
jgi:hypothetical protein